MLQFETILYATGDGVATITLNQPDTRNALSNELLGELIDAFEAARDDDEVRCVVLTSSHDKVFSSGANLAGFAADVPIVHSTSAPSASRAVPADRRARQADDLRGQRPRAGGRARASRWPAT